MKTGTKEYDLPFDRYKRHEEENQDLKRHFILLYSLHCEIMQQNSALSEQISA